MVNELSVFEPLKFYCIYRDNTVSSNHFEKNVYTFIWLKHIILNSELRFIFTVEYVAII